MISTATDAMVNIAAEVVGERERQVAKWGPQLGRPDGWLGSLWYRTNRHVYTRTNDERQARGEEGHWDDILLEEVFEALSERDLAKLRVELIQVAAVCAAWVEALDAR